MPSFPGVKAEILLDAPNDPAGAGVWIDVTSYLVSFSTKRGRQDETTDVGPETMQWKLRNTDGRFDPFNPGTLAAATTQTDSSSGGRNGTLVGSVLPTTATSPWSGFGQALVFDGVGRGANTSGVDLGTSTGLCVSGVGAAATFCIEAKVRTGSSGASGVIIERANTSGGGGTLQPGIGGGVGATFFVQTRDNGGTYRVVNGTTTALANTSYDVAGTYDGTTLRLYVNGTMENSLALSGVEAPTAGIHTYIGRIDDATNPNPFSGTVDEVRISKVARYTAGSYTPSATPFTTDANTLGLWHLDDTTGVAAPYYPNLKTNRQARMNLTWNSVTYPLFRGYEDTGWPQVYEARGRYGYCTPTFVTALSFLSNVDLLDCVLQEMLVDAPLALYPLSDGAGASQAGNISAFKLANAGMTPGSPITVGPVGSFAFGAVGVIPSASGLSATQFVGPTAGTSFGPNLLLPSSAMPSLTAGASFEFFFEISQTPTATSSLIAQVSGPSGGSIGVTYVSTSTTSGTINLTNQSPGGSFGSVTGPIVIVGQFAHVVVTLDVALTTATLWVNGNNAGSGVTAPAWTAGTLASVAAGGVTIPTGVTLSLGPVATYAKVLSATRIAAHYQAGMTAFWGESAGNRIKRLLSYASWLPALQSIDTTSDGDSNTPLLGATDLNGTNVTAAMQQVANSVLGDLDVTGDGKVRYRSRDYRMTQLTPAVTFGEITAGGEIPYTAAPNIGQKRDQLVGGVIVKQRDGITAVRGNAQAVLDGNGVKSYDVILANPVQVIDFADEMLRRYKDGHERIESVELNPIGYSTMWPSVLGIDFGSRVRTMRRPNGTYTKQIDGYIESIAHDVTVDFDGGTTWKTTLTGSPLAPGNPFILDVSLLDSADVLTF